METLNYTYTHKLIRWFSDKIPITNKTTDLLYNQFMLAYNEDEKLFIKVALYMAGNRTQFTDTHYRLTLHFLATNYPEKLMSNLPIFVEVGHITDLLYLKEEPVIANRINTFISYHSKFNTKYKALLNGPVIVNNFDKYFKFKLKKYNYDKFIENLNNSITNII